MMTNVVSSNEIYMGMAEDFARTINHDLGYDSYLKNNDHYDKLRITKFDALKLLSEHTGTIGGLMTFITRNLRSKRDAARTCNETQH